MLHFFPLKRFLKFYMVEVSELQAECRDEASVLHQFFLQTLFKTKQNMKKIELHAQIRSAPREHSQGYPNFMMNFA